MPTRCGLPTRSSPWLPRTAWHAKLPPSSFPEFPFPNIMHRLNRFIVLISLLAASHVGAAPADAQQIMKSYQLAQDKCALEMRNASTPEERAKAWGGRPDTASFARELWAEIGQSLTAEWTLESAAWFLRNPAGLLAGDAAGGATSIFARENEAIRKAIETHHLKSARLIPVC